MNNPRMFWKAAYQSAITETDRAKGRVKVDHAIQAITLRMIVITEYPKDSRERHEIAIALADLKVFAWIFRGAATAASRVS